MPGSDLPSTGAANSRGTSIAAYCGPLLKRYPGIQKITANLGWLSIDYVVRLAGGIVVGAWVARYLGPVDFGQFNYCLAIIALVSAPAGLGLEGILGRDLIRMPDQEGKLLGTSFFLRLVMGLVLYFGLSAYALIAVDDASLRTLL